MNFGLKDKVVLVTGASQGIGAACVERFAREGAKLVLADVDTRGQALAEQVGGLFVACDVGDAASVNALVAAAVTRFGRIDVLVNNAGIVHTADFLDVSEADFDRVIRVNVKGAFLVAQAVARAMVAAKTAGSIINMSSVNGTLAIPNIASYNMSKGAANQLTRVMALALVDHGIRVNAVAPGTIATELAKNAVLTSDAARKKILSRTPMKRLGEPSEVADLVAFLASDAASYITGEIVTIDGGRMAMNYTVSVD
jgi:NAD(P)-dependent dehydrogenase (short-subunit alcohol dehydrogenase family)